MFIFNPIPPKSAPQPDQPTSQTTVIPPTPGPTTTPPFGGGTTPPSGSAPTGPIPHVPTTPPSGSTTPPRGGNTVLVPPTPGATGPILPTGPTDPSNGGTTTPAGGGVFGDGGTTSGGGSSGSSGSSDSGSSGSGSSGGSSGGGGWFRSSRGQSTIQPLSPTLAERTFLYGPSRPTPVMDTGPVVDTSGPPSDPDPWDSRPMMDPGETWRDSDPWEQRPMMDSGGDVDDREAISRVDVLLQEMTLENFDSIREQLPDFVYHDGKLKPKDYFFSPGRFDAEALASYGAGLSPATRDNYLEILREKLEFDKRSAAKGRITFVDPQLPEVAHIVKPLPDGPNAPYYSGLAGGDTVREYYDQARFDAEVAEAEGKQIVVVDRPSLKDLGLSAAEFLPGASAVMTGIAAYDAGITLGPDRQFGIALGTTLGAVDPFVPVPLNKLAKAPSTHGAGRPASFPRPHQRGMSCP